MRWLSLLRDGNFEDMIVRMLVEYEVLGDDEYAYVEWFDHILPNEWSKDLLNSYTRGKVVRMLINRGIVVKKIKEISVEYVRSKECKGL